MKIAHSLDIKSLRVFEAVASMDNLVRSQLYKESILIVVPKDKAQRARHNGQGTTIFRAGLGRMRAGNAIYPLFGTIALAEKKRGPSGKTSH